MAWLYVRGRRGSILGSSSFSASGIELSVTLSGKPTQQPASWRGWKTRPWIALLSGMTCTPSQADLGVGQWISSRLASHASRGAQPESASAPMTPAGSGRPLRGSFAKWDRDSSFLKTSRLLFEEDYTTFSGLWPSSGSMLNGICFRRPRRVRRNAGSGCSFWPTATTANGNEQTAAEPTPGQTGGTTLAGAAAFWATPAARDWKSGDASAETLARNARPLNEQAAHWPTPAARDGDPRRAPTNPNSAAWRNKVARGAVNAAGMLSDDLSSSAVAWISSLPDLEAPKDGAESSPIAPTSRRRLNPNFVDWLMGWPPGWSGCAPLETASCPSRPLSPSQNSGRELAHDVPEA